MTAGSSSTCASRASSRSPTARRVEGWLIRDPRDIGAWAAAARHPRRAAQRVERRRRPGARLPPGPRRARLDGAAAQPAGERRVRRGVLHRRRRRVGRRGRQGLPRADRGTGRRGDRRPGTARRHRLLLRRLHDLLPDEQGLPVRRRRGRRGGLRPDQHGRHLGRRARAVGLGVGRGLAPWPGLLGQRPDNPGHRRDHADAAAARGRRHPVPRRAGGGVARGAARAGGGHATGPLPGRVAPVHSRRHAVTSDRLQPAGGGLGGTVRKHEQAGRRSTPRTGSAASRCSPSGTRSPARRSASCGCGTRRPARRARRGRLRLRERAREDRGDHRHAVPDRVHVQGVDRDRGHAARRRGQARPGRAGRRGAARAAARRRRRRQDRHHAAAAQPHQRHRRRRVHRHRPRRRLRGEVRRR